MKAAPRLLVSVRSRAEAELAHASGVSIIDFKEPDRGALGPVAPEILEDCMSAFPKAMLSVVLGEVGEVDSGAQGSESTVGSDLTERSDLSGESGPTGVWESTGHPEVACAIELTAGRGLGFLKLGVDFGDARQQPRPTGVSSPERDPTRPNKVQNPEPYPKVTALQATASGTAALRRIEQACALVAPAVAAGDRVILVFYAEHTLPLQFLPLLAARGVHGVMLDTRKKHGPSLLGCQPKASLRAFVEAARATGLTVGLAGRLRLDDLPEIAALGPDVIGMRGGLCRQSVRTGALDPGAVAAALAALTTTFSTADIEGG